MAQSLAFWTAVTLYACATLLFFVWLAFQREGAARWGLAAAAAALVPHCAALALRWQEVGHGPFSTRYEVLDNPDMLVEIAEWRIRRSADSTHARGCGHRRLCTAVGDVGRANQGYCHPASALTGGQ